MSELWTVLQEASDQLTLVGALIIVIFVVVFGVQQPEPKEEKETTPDGEVVTIIRGDRWGRPWWVPGWLYKECVRDRKRYEAEVKTYVDALKARVERLESPPQHHSTDTSQ